MIDTPKLEIAAGRVEADSLAEASLLLRSESQRLVRLAEGARDLSQLLRAETERARLARAAR